MASQSSSSYRNHFAYTSLGGRCALRLPAITCSAPDTPHICPTALHCGIITVADCNATSGPISIGPSEDISLKFDLTDLDGNSVGDPSNLKARGDFPAGHRFMTLAGKIRLVFPAIGEYTLDITADEEKTPFLYQYHIEVTPNPDKVTAAGMGAKVMTNQIEQTIHSTYEYLNGLKDNTAVADDVSWFTYILSLLPVPGLQQAAQVATKIASDHGLNQRFSEVKRQVIETNERVSLIESDMERIKEIAQTVASVTKLQALLRDFLDAVVSDLQSEPTEFVMDTSDWSVQTLIKSVVEADWVAVSALHHSRNEILDSEIKSKKTHLKAHDHSRNVVANSEFKGEKGSVAFRGLHTQRGQMSLSDSCMGFGSDSTTQMGKWVMGTDSKGNFIIGTRPQVVTAQCPKCSSTFQVSQEELVGRTQLQCPSCGKMSRLG